MNQKLEADKLKVVANNQGYQVKGEVKINGQTAALDYRKPNDGDADINCRRRSMTAAAPASDSIWDLRSVALFRSS